MNETKRAYYIGMCENNKTYTDHIISRLESLDYKSASGCNISEFVLEAIRCYGSNACLLVEYNTYLNFANKDYCRKCGYQVVDIDELIGKKKKEENAFDNLVIVCYNGAYQVCRLTEDKYYEPIGEYNWKELSWAESELKVRNELLMLKKRADNEFVLEESRAK